MACEKYSLTYFNARGRAEAIRLVFAAAGKTFEDKRIAFPEWQTLKPNTPHGSLPILVVDGKQTIPQSMAIMRFLAREFDLYGRSRDDNAWVDVYIETITELYKKALEANFGEESKKKELQEALQNVEIPKYLALLEKTAGDTTGFLVGTGRTVADTYLYALCETLKLQTVIEGFPKLKASFSGVQGDSKVQEYIKKRPETPF